MTFGSRDPTVDDAISALIAFETVSDVPAYVTDSIFTRQLSRLMRSLNLLLEHPGFEERAQRAIARIGFPL
jgi:hypothetical protein